MEGFDPTVIMAVTALLMPVIGAFMAITPYLMRRGEVFTVTVPTSEQHDPYVVGLKRRYAAIVGSATAVFTVIGFASAAMGNAGGVLGALIVGSLAVTAGGYALMLEPSLSNGTCCTCPSWPSPSPWARWVTCICPT